MSRPIYCAKCGAELTSYLKAIPNEMRVITIVVPHTCNEKDIEKLNWKLKSKPKLEKANEKKGAKELLDSFPFVQKLNKGAMEQESTGHVDKRNKKHLREELITSSAPMNILDAAKNR